MLSLTKSRLTEKTLFFVFIFILCRTSILAQTNVPGGNVSGTWTAADSPYNIQGDITIPAGQSLTIEPGVDVYFMNWSLLTVNGFLEAIGTESDSIHFAPETIQGTWKGLFFDNAPDNSHLDYCSISGVLNLHVHSHIHCTNNSDPVISHCRITGYADYVYYGNIWVESGSNPSISDCVITEGKTAIYWNSNVSNATISGCTISNCTASGVVNILGNLTMTDCSIINNNSQEYPGGGIRSENGNLTLINCTISDNTAQSGRGGGVSCTNGTATFTNCTINSNVAIDNVTGQGGGGISLYNGSGILAYCSIYDNYAMDHGGGIAVTNGNLIIDHCTIDENETMDASTGSGISILTSNTTIITNSIISNNFYGYGIYNSGTLTVGNTDFFNNTTGSIYGNIPTGFGQLTQVNTNGDSCDVFSNIFLDPLFVGSPDFHLTATSPCIDAGDSAFAYDPDGTITDMGALFFDQGGTGIPGGYVSGTWTASGSPYRILGDITIHADSTLNIEPGVDVEFQGGYLLRVEGYLQAIGTEADSINFFPADPIWGWQGIYFFVAPDSSHLVYCTITNCDLPVNCWSSSPVISHCTITYGEYCAIHVVLSGSPEISHCTIMNNQSGIYWLSTDDGTISNCIISHNANGGGIKLDNYTELTIIDCIISDNTNNERGGGVRSDLGTLNLINCTISDNSAGLYRGGGVACTQCTATITNCTINGNEGHNSYSGTNSGGGISLYNASANLSYCTIFDNYSIECGAGIALTNGNLTVDHCTIDKNYTIGTESGIYIESGTANIANTIISNNFPDCGIYNSGTLTIGNTDFFNNTGGAINGSIPTGFGVLTQVNVNLDSCDVYSNIFLDPLYVDPVNYDLHLTAGSPCIDAGDPAFAYDPDGTITDMGAYYFHQTTALDPPQNVTVEIIGTDVYLNWDAVTGANSYKVYSSDDPYIGFVEDTSGVFAGESWSTSILNEKKFYHVIASTEIIRSKYSDSQGAYHPDRKSRRYESDKFIKKKRN